LGTTTGKRIVHQVDTLWRVSSGCERAKRLSTKHRLLERDPHGNTTRGGRRRRRHTAEHEGRVRWSRRRRWNKCVAGMSLRHLMIIHGAVVALLLFWFLCLFPFHSIVSREFLSFLFLLLLCSPSPIASLYPRFIHPIRFSLGLVSTGEAFFTSSFSSSFVVFLAFSI